jgi:hypothetical protein
VFALRLLWQRAIRLTFEEFPLQTSGAGSRAHLISSRGKDQGVERSAGEAGEEGGGRLPRSFSRNAATAVGSYRGRERAGVREGRSGDGTRMATGESHRNSNVRRSSSALGHMHESGGTVHAI